MNRGKTQQDIGSGESYKRIREGLRAEKDRRWGEVGSIEADVGFSSGYLSKICRGKESIRVERLLQLLERMGVDPGRFFANALGTRPDNDALLEEVEHLGEIDRRLAHIEKVTREVELTSSGPAPDAVDAEAMLADLLSCSGREQRRRLGAGQKYRDPSFAAAYLERLDALRYDNPKQARLNAETMAVKLIPRLPGSRPERIALQLKAIGVYASCQRQKGEFATAARALRSALGISRRHGLKRITGELLQRAAAVVAENLSYSDVMELLDEALVIYVDLDLKLDLGTLMVDRGTALCKLGEYQASIAAIGRALELLEGNSPRTIRNRLAAHQELAQVYRALGDLERAEAALAEAVAESTQAGSLYRAALLWDHGVIALDRGCNDLAEESLRGASELFDSLKDRNKALVALDLAKVLILQGKNLEAVATAMTMAEYLKTFRGNVVQAAITDLIQTALRGNLTLGAIERAQADLRTAQDQSPVEPER